MSKQELSLNPLTKDIDQNLLDQFLQVGLDAVREAEKIVMKYFETDLVVANSKETHDTMSKHYKSPATIADEEAEKIIKKTIAHVFPAHGFLGEEGGSEGNGDYRRIIDPIDGTKFYMRGMDNRAILLALQYKGEVILGISLMPVVGELVHATKGGGCWINGVQCYVSDHVLSDAMIAHERYKFFEREGMVDCLNNLRSEVVHYMGAKTPRQFHYLVQGKMDLIVGPPGMCLYDIAPYIVMMKEAGGVFTTLDGQEVREEMTSFVASNTFMHENVLSYFVS